MQVRRFISGSQSKRKPAGGSRRRWTPKCRVAAVGEVSALGGGRPLNSRTPSLIMHTETESITTGRSNTAFGNGLLVMFPSRHTSSCRFSRRQAHVSVSQSPSPSTRRYRLFLKLDGRTHPLVDFYTTTSPHGTRVISPFCARGRTFILKSPVVVVTSLGHGTVCDATFGRTTSSTGRPSRQTCPYAAWYVSSHSVSYTQNRDTFCNQRAVDPTAVPFTLFRCRFFVNKHTTDISDRCAFSCLRARA